MDVAAPTLRFLVNGPMSFITREASLEFRAMFVGIMDPGCREHAVSPSAPYRRWSSFENKTLHSFAWPYATNPEYRAAVSGSRSKSSLLGERCDSLDTMTTRPPP